MSEYAVFTVYYMESTGDGSFMVIQQDVGPEKEVHNYPSEPMDFDAAYIKLRDLTRQ